jgi:hypothetical protein
MMRSSSCNTKRRKKEQNLCPEKPKKGRQCTCQVLPSIAGWRDPREVVHSSSRASRAKAEQSWSMV